MLSIELGYLAWSVNWKGSRISKISNINLTGSNHNNESSAASIWRAFSYNFEQLIFNNLESLIDSRFKIY